MILEPFISMLGMGNFSIRPSPFCAFGTLLVNSAKLSSYPVTRIFDMDRMFEEMMPIAKNTQGNSGKIGYFDGFKIPRIVKSCIRKESAHLLPPDLFSYVTDKSKTDITRKTIANAQFFIVHNNMDVACVDAIRRQRSAVCCYSASSPSGIAATSTICI